MTTHQGLPVNGYVSQSDDKVALVNDNKELEERVLRRIDDMLANANMPDGFDPRMIALAKTQIQSGFMWLNRAVFQPTRVPLPEDAE